MIKDVSNPRGTSTLVSKCGGLRFKFQYSFEYYHLLDGGRREEAWCCGKGKFDR